MANLPEKNITTVDKITSIPSNTNVFLNANGELKQADIDNVLKASNVINDSIVNQFKTATGTLILATDSSNGNIIDFTVYGRSEQDGKPTPDNPIYPISVADNNVIEIKTTNKNQLNNIATSQTKNGGTITVNKDKSITVNGTFTALTEIKIASNVEVKANEQILSGCPSGGSSTTYEIQLYSSSQGGAIARDFGNGRTTTISGIATAYLIIRSGVAVSNLTFYPMLRPVGTDDNYVPHKERTEHIPLSEPLRSSFNGSVADEIKKVDSLYGESRKLIELIFDGSDDEGWSGMITYPDRFYIPASKLPNLKPRTIVICSHYTYSANLATVDYGIYLGNDLNVKNKDITTFSDFKASLSANPITVIAELAEETFEPFTDQTPFYKMRTYDGVTHIECEAEIKVEYPTSRTAGIASIGFAKGNLADIKMEQLSAQILEVQTALLNV